VVLLVLSIVAAVVAVQARDQAETRRQLATSRQLTAQAINNLQRRPDLALLLSVEAYGSRA